MPKALKVVRAPVSVDFRQILIKRDKKPDLQINSGRLLLTAETERSKFGDPQMIPQNQLVGGERWRIWNLYENREGDRAIVASEGHSTLPRETTLYSATVCKNGAEVWKAMGELEELKPVLAELNWPAIEEI